MVLLPCGDCCPAPPVPDCGCTDFEQYTALKNKVINITFSNFGYSGRFGISIGGCFHCTTPNMFFAPSSSEASAWSNHFNAVAVTLAFDSATTYSMTWKGSSPVMSSPSGGTVQYFYKGVAQCGGAFYLFPDTSMGCQQNTGFATLTSAYATQSPITFAPGTNATSASPPNTTCGNLLLSSTIQGISGSQVFCAKEESSGCLGAAGCADLYRWGFSGNFQATIETNALP
jgi:hypothetical protein